jgi:LAGLIDADG DNA endonuclease family
MSVWHRLITVEPTPGRRPIGAIRWVIPWEVCRKCSTTSSSGPYSATAQMRCKTNALLEVNHSSNQRGYVDWKYQHLADLVRTPPRTRTGNGGRIAYRFVTRSLEQLTPYFRLFYGSGKKRVSRCGSWTMEVAREARCI